MKSKIAADQILKRFAPEGRKEDAIRVATERLATSTFARFRHEWTPIDANRSVHSRLFAVSFDRLRLRLAEKIFQIDARVAEGRRTDLGT